MRSGSSLGEIGAPMPPGTIPALVVRCWIYYHLFILIDPRQLISDGFTTPPRVNRSPVISLLLEPYFSRFRR